MARIGVLCQSAGAGGRWQVRRLPHLVRRLIADGENQVVLLGEERLETRLGDVVGNLTGRRSFEGICEELSICDLAICVDEQCYPAVAVPRRCGAEVAAATDIPIVGLFFGTMHFDVIAPDFEDFTALYPDLNGTLSSIPPSLVAERALARLSGEAPPREVVRPPLPQRNCAEALWSIIVAAHDRTEDQIESTRRCIEALREHTRVMHEILVVDRESNAQTVSYVKSQGDLRGVFLRGRGSSAEAVRMGAEAASGEVLLFLHNDQYVQRGWEEDYIEALEGGTALAGTQAWKLGPEGVVRALELKEGAFLGFDGAAIRRDVLRAAGGLPAEAMAEYAELADLCWRLKELTFEVKLLESPRIRHVGYLTRARAGPGGSLAGREASEAWRGRTDISELHGLLVRWPDMLPEDRADLRDELRAQRRARIAAVLQLEDEGEHSPEALRQDVGVADAVWREAGGEGIALGEAPPEVESPPALRERKCIPADRLQLRVCFLVPQLMLGGGEVQLLTLCGSLDRDKFELSTVSLNVPTREDQGVIARSHATVTSELRRVCEVYEAEPEWSRESKVAFAGAKLRELDPDIVVFHGTTLAADVLREVSPRPYIVQVCHTEIDAFSGEVYGDARDLVDRLVAVQDHIGERLISRYGAPADKVVTIANGVSPSRVTKSNSQERQPLTPTPSEEEGRGWRGQETEPVVRISRGNAVRERPAERVSVIVLTANRSARQLESTRKCLELLTRNTSLPHELIVVDAGSDEATLCYLGSQRHMQRLLLPTQASVAEAFNLGARIAGGEVLAFLHNDQYVRPGWDRKLVQELTGQVGIVGTEPWHFEGEGEPFADGLEEQSGFVRACGMAVRRNLFWQLGGFDTGLGPSFSLAADLCYRAAGLGCRIAAAEGRIIEHRGSVTISRCDQRVRDGVRALMHKWPERLGAAVGAARTAQRASATREAPSSPVSPATKAAEARRPAASVAGPVQVGSDLRERLGIAPWAFVVGYLGRLGREKRLEDLMAAFGRSKADHLLIGGWGGEEQRLRAKVRQLGLEGSVTFAGTIHDPAEFYAAIDVFALVSDTEGMPLTTIEAMLAGVPIVATRVGAVPDMLTDGESALLVAKRDVDGIERAIDRLRSDRGLANRLATAARAIAQARYTDRQMARGYQEVFCEAARQLREPPQRVIFRRPAGIGDILMTTPAVRHMREQFPAADIVYVTDPRYAEVLELNPCVSEVAASCSRGDGDLEIEFVHEDVWDTGVSIIDKYLTLVEAPCGADRRIELFLSAEDRQFAQAFHARLPSAPMVVIHTHSNIGCKDWPQEHWTELVEWLKESSCVVQVGAAGEEVVPGAVDATGIAANAPLRKTAALVERAAFAVCVESCVQHFAAAVGTPAVVLYGGSSPVELSAYPENVNVVTPSSCRCDRSRGSGGACPHDLECMSALTPERVMAAIGSAGLLAGR